MRPAICPDPLQGVVAKTKTQDRLQSFWGIVAMHDVRMQVVLNPSRPTVFGNSEGYGADSSVIFPPYQDKGTVSAELLIRLLDARRYIFPGLMLT